MSEKNKKPWYERPVDLYDPDSAISARLKFESNATQREMCDVLKLMVDPDAITFPQELDEIGEKWNVNRVIHVAQRGVE